MLFHFVQILYWLALSTWFGGVLFMLQPDSELWRWETAMLLAWVIERRGLASLRPLFVTEQAFVTRAGGRAAVAALVGLPVDSLVSRTAAHYSHEAVARRCAHR